MNERPRKRLRITAGDEGASMSHPCETESATANPHEGGDEEPAVDTEREGEGDEEHDGDGDMQPTAWEESSDDDSDVSSTVVGVVDNEPVVAVAIEKKEAKPDVPEEAKSEEPAASSTEGETAAES